MRIVATGHTPVGVIPVKDPNDHRLSMSERVLHEAVEELAANRGWHSFHTYLSRHSKAGFPDLVLWHTGLQRTLFVELKSTSGMVREDQDATLQQLADAGQHVHIWRPADWITGTIAAELRRR
jgi:hypothetical protein